MKKKKSRGHRKRRKNKSILIQVNSWHSNLKNRQLVRKEDKLQAKEKLKLRLKVLRVKLLLLNNPKRRSQKYNRAKHKKANKREGLLRVMESA